MPVSLAGGSARAVPRNATLRLPTRACGANRDHWAIRTTGTRPLRLAAAQGRLQIGVRVTNSSPGEPSQPDTHHSGDSRVGQAEEPHHDPTERHYATIEGGVVQMCAPVRAYLGTIARIHIRLEVRAKQSQHLRHNARLVPATTRRTPLSAYRLARQLIITRMARQPAPLRLCAREINCPQHGSGESWPVWAMGEGELPPPFRLRLIFGKC